jgi:hypothetical protein
MHDKPYMHHYLSSFRSTNIQDVLSCTTTAHKAITRRSKMPSLPVPRSVGSGSVLMDWTIITRSRTGSDALSEKK